MPLVASLLIVWSLVMPLGTAPGACTAVHVIGVRGSGQTGFGDHVATYVDGIEDHLRSEALSTSSVALDYPAISLADSFGFALFTGEYDRSVDRGVAALDSELDGLRTSCPGTSIVLVGYSQGAQVIKQTFAERPPVDRILAAILLADPSRDVSQPGVGRIGSVDPTDEGSLGGVRVGSSLRPSTVDICAVGDAVCTGVGIDFATHIDGYRAVEPAVLEFVDRFVAGSTLARRPIR